MDSEKKAFIPKEADNTAGDKPKRPSAREAERKARDYGDAIPEEGETVSVYEPTYRDGSLKNECW